MNDFSYDDGSSLLSLGWCMGLLVDPQPVPVIEACPVVARNVVFEDTEGDDE